eukprot:TRINITY_DN41735_c0_g1_i1.p1 TRINITY_DN41735_c0_g1~~TRINITY_DN41735_c0_g1_i1.p1  ORF type:complete len:249 (-),score=61.09 TRINITY_DN41735_c0_g1_i1:180-926(-)
MAACHQPAARNVHRASRPVLLAGLVIVLAAAGMMRCFVAWQLPGLRSVDKDSRVTMMGNWYYRTKQIKRRQTEEALRRNPPPAMGVVRLNRRILKISLFRRQDEFLASQFLINDPRIDRWQWDLDKVRQYMDEQATLVDDVKRRKLTTREDIGLPLPPTDLKLSALARAKAKGSLVQASKAAAEDKVKEEAEGKKKKKMSAKAAEDKGPDLSMVDVEFMNYKGLVMTKKQKAAQAAKAQLQKKFKSKR